MKEVAGRTIALYVDIAAQQGLDPRELVRGLNIDPTDLRTRVSWDTTLELIRRIRDGLGGNLAVEDAFTRFELTSPDLVALTPHFVSPMALARFINVTLAPRNITSVSSTMRELSGQRFDYRVVVTPGFASDPALIYGTVGLLRGQPRLLGLPEAHVTWEGNEYDFTCRVILPASRDVSTRARRQAEDARQRAEKFLRAALSDGVVADRMAESEQRLLQRLGDAAQEPSTAEEFAETALRLLHEELSTSFGFLWSTSPTGRRLLASHGVRDGFPTVVPIALGGHPVAVLEADGSIGRQSLAAMAPLLALALQRRLDTRSPALGAAVFPAEWRLTKRQREVAELIFLGKNNPAIASTLGCSVGTVEAHVTAIFDKAGVDGRHVLSARLGEFRRGL